MHAGPNIRKGKTCSDQGKAGGGTGAQPGTEAADEERQGGGSVKKRRDFMYVSADYVTAGRGGWKTAFPACCFFVSGGNVCGARKCT